MARSRKAKPSTPEQIAERLARRREAEREALRAAKRRGESVVSEEALWGPLSPDVLALPTAADIAPPRSAKAPGRRLNVFRSLMAMGAISEDQHRAAERYLEERESAMGVSSFDGFRLTAIDGGRSHDGVSQRMVDAGARVRGIEGRLPRRSLKVLRSIADPMVAGEVFVWRARVQHASGETDRHAQGAAVRAALDDLVEGLELFDADERARRREQGQDGRAA